MPLLAYTSSGFPFVPFTKIFSADVNQCFFDIRTLLNVTGLDDSNLQVNGISLNRLKTGTALNLIGFDASGNPTSISQSSLSNNFAAVNSGVSSSTSANILTIALKQADGVTDPSTGFGMVTLPFRSGTATNGQVNRRTVSAALSQTFSVQTTLGLASGVASTLYVYGIDSDGAGTIKLGASATLLDTALLQSTVAESFTGSVTIAAPGVWTATGHGLANKNQVRLTTTGSLPTGLVTGNTYFVSGVTANSFRLSAAPGGSEITTTGSQSGVHTIHIADSSLLASGAVYASVPISLIGRITVVNTSGNWGSASVVSSSQPLLAAPLAVRYSDSAGQVIGNGTTSLAFSTKAYTTSDNLVPTTSPFRFLAVVAGYYQINASIAASSLTADTTFQLRVAVNGTVIAQSGGSEPTGASTDYEGASVSDLLNLAYGDVVTVQCFQNGTSSTLTSVAADNFVSIYKAF